MPNGPDKSIFNWMVGRMANNLLAFAPSLRFPKINGDSNANNLYLLLEYISF